MPGFCRGCPVPELLDEIVQGNVRACETGLLRNNQIRVCVSELVRLIVGEGECIKGPDNDEYDEGTDFVSCMHENWERFAMLADALVKPGDQTLDLIGKMVKKESTT